MPGERLDNSPYISEMDFSQIRMRVSTDRYSSREWHERERERLWMRTWQVAGRAEEIPQAGDWMEYRIFDQSYVLVRGRDGVIRGFVNACRHRSNAFCQGKGSSARFTCPYHNWTYGLDGKLLAVPKPDFDGTVEEFVGAKEELGLIEVPVECFAGFIFLNPDRNAASFAEFMGEAIDLLAPYRVDEMVAYGLNVRESLNCNWKVVMDAFQEGYHIQGVHPELVAAMDESKERYLFFGDHSVATAPFGASNMAEISMEDQIGAIRDLPSTFPAVADALPRFDELLDVHRGPNGKLAFEGEVTLRSLLHRAMRESWTAKGLDVSQLTDGQMSDNQFYLLFPNFFMTIHAGEATVITSAPHPDGDPNRCFWHVLNLQWFPPEEREAKREALLEIAENDHFTYFLALEQDYAQMERQQVGLRQRTQDFMSLTRQEVRLAHYHAALDSWMAGGSGA
jgi:phenylpropionate dioxygenase-like ring-hydroxylating dioxygenase large terminal subunit